MSNIINFKNRAFIISISIGIIMALTACVCAEVVPFPSYTVIGIAWRLDVENTRLAVAGYEDMDGIAIIEAVERPDKTFAIGLQFHLESAIVKQLEGVEDADKNMDYDTGIRFFARLIEAASDDIDEAV